tara:strand:+ start:6422 stop:7195 length:774 start_codon:yes stop_codon:yes gene_type:complete
MGTVLASDISGSSLTIAFQNSEQDAAMRKFLVSSTSRGDAISTVTTALTAAGVGANHPDESNLKANQITAQAVGPSRWLVSVRYIRLRIGGLPSGADTTLCNMRVSSEAVQVYCTPIKFQDGLPWGGDGKNFVNPGSPTGFSAQENDKPKPWVYNRPVVNIQVPFSSNVNPVAARIGNVSKTNAGVITLGGVEFQAEEVRYDGAEIRSVVPSGAGIGGIRYFGTESYTAAYGGWAKQILEWEDDAWIAKNVRMYDTA